MMLGRVGLREPRITNTSANPAKPSSPNPIISELRDFPSSGIVNATAAFDRTAMVGAFRGIEASLRSGKTGGGGIAFVFLCTSRIFTTGCAGGAEVLIRAEARSKMASGTFAPGLSAGSVFSGEGISRAGEEATSIGDFAVVGSVPAGAF